MIHLDLKTINQLGNIKCPEQHHLSMSELGLYILWLEAKKRQLFHTEAIIIGRYLTPFSTRATGNYPYHDPNVICQVQKST